MSKTPCGECHLHHGETCDICGAKRPPRRLIPYDIPKDATPLEVIRREAGNKRIAEINRAAGYVD